MDTVDGLRQTGNGELLLNHVVVPSAPRAARRTPRPGDLVIVREAQPGTYSLRKIPDKAQIFCHSRAEAVQVAEAFARDHGTGVWYCEDQTYTLLRVQGHRHE
jgi:hypothetical protein